MKRNEVRNEQGRFVGGDVEYLRRRENVPIVCGIYKITNPNGAIYIGGSRTIYRRWLRHREARKKIKIHLSIKEYGWKAHTFEVVHQLPLDVSNETLIQYEQLYIDRYRECGFEMLNVKDAGSSAKFNSESKDKMSKAQRKSYKVLRNGVIVEFVGLKQFCKENGLAEKCMSDLLNGNGHYKTTNYYKGFKGI